MHDPIIVSYYLAMFGPQKSSNTHKPFPRSDAFRNDQGNPQSRSYDTISCPCKTAYFRFVTLKTSSSADLPAL